MSYTVHTRPVQVGLRGELSRVRWQVVDGKWRELAGGLARDEVAAQRDAAAAVLELRRADARAYAERVREFGAPCKYAHLGCSAYTGGPCLDELFGELELDNDGEPLR